MMDRIENILVDKLSGCTIQRPEPNIIHIIDLQSATPQLWVIRIDGPHEAPWRTK